MHTKRELIDALAKKTGQSKKDTETTLDALTEITIAAVSTGDGISLPGLGKLVVTDVAERVGRNPSTNEPLTIPAGKKVKFRATTALRTAAKHGE